MKRITVVLTVGLLAFGLLAITGCSGELEIEGKYLNPEGGKLELRVDGTMSVTKLEGASTIEGTYEVKEDELELYGPDPDPDEPLMTFRIGEDELIDITGLIWVKQPE
jgi:hypothetical protein